MFISERCAHSIKYFRSKNYILGFISSLGLVQYCYWFITKSNTFYELIYFSQLIIAYFMLIIVYYNQILVMKQTQYVLTMSYLINETETLEFEQTDQQIEEMIKEESLDKVSKWAIFYTSIKICFHSFCCESKDFLYLYLSAAVIVSFFFEKRFQQGEMYTDLILLFLTTVCDFVLVTLGFFIEMPRRIRQYYKMRVLRRRATRLQFLNSLGQIQDLRYNSQKGQSELTIVLLQNNSMEERQTDQIQQPNNQNVQDEELLCQICFEDMNKNANIQQLKCHSSHIFHSQCIANWFERKREQNKVPICPICRTPQNE